MRLRYQKKVFRFNFPAYTSRGTLYERESWFLILYDESEMYVGECAPLPGLSRESIEHLPMILHDFCQVFNNYQHFPKFDDTTFPSVMFAIESIRLQLQHRQQGILFPSTFTRGEKGIAINGLIWAGRQEQVLQQVEEKINAGFPCIKMKIGALSFEEEMEILASIRNRYPQLEIRLDANGAFSTTEALAKIKQLSQYNIHSIEQPIAPDQWSDMKQICEYSSIPVALDEELIPLVSIDKKKRMLDYIRPAYIILKPTLLGGFSHTETWIRLAEERQIGWWITSALESNVGLNAIAQWTYQMAPNKVHGLGTGRIYQNNIPSPIHLKEGKLFFNPENIWNYTDFDTNPM